MMRLHAVWLLLLALCQGAMARAGECIDSEAYYVRWLEAGPDSGHRFNYAVYCLGVNPLVIGHRWAGPIAAERFSALRADSLQPRITAAISNLLVSAWADSGEHRDFLARIAARHGIATVDSFDVFATLIEASRHPYVRIYPDLAVLQECKAVPFLRQRYEDLRANPGRGYTDEIFDVLNCLYHIPCADAAIAAEVILTQEPDTLLRERLARVVNR